MKWAEVIAKPDFQELGPSDQAYVRQSWWDHFVGPDLKANGIPDDEIQSVRQQSLSSFDNGQGYVSSFASSVGRGVAGAGTGIIGGLGAITGNEELRQTANEMDASIAESLPVNPSLKYTNLAGNAIGQAGAMLATGGAAGVAGKALGGIRAGTIAASAGVLGTGGISEARSAADEADQYGITGDARALKIASGIFTGVGTEFIPFGLGVELRGVKTLLGAGERVVGKRAGSVIKDLASEPVEEVIGQMGNNAATAALAPAGTETPGLMSGTGDAAFGGLAGGATFAGFNAAAGANRPAPGAPPTASPSTDGLPPPAGFAQDPAVPAAPGIPGRASVVNPATPAARPAVLTDAELAAMEAAPPVVVNESPKMSDNGFSPQSVSNNPTTEQTPVVPSPAPVPQDRINITAAAIATSDTPEVEAAVIETARIAANLHAQKTATPSPVETPAISPPAPPSGIPMAEGQPAAPEIAPASEISQPAIPISAPGLEQAPAVVQKSKPKSRRFEADPGTYPLVTAIVEAGISPRNPAAELARGRANRGENLTPKHQTILQKNGGYNDVPKVSEFAGRPRAQDAIRKMLRNGSQNTPDVALLQAAGFAGRDPQEFYGNTAWQEIRDELMKLDDTSPADKEDARMNAMEKQALEFYAAIGEGKYQVDVTTMEPGDSLIIEGETVKVKKVNRDGNGDIRSVELQDGSKFGRQEIDATTALFVEEFQEDPTDQTPDAFTLVRNGNGSQSDDNQSVITQAGNGVGNIPVVADNATTAPPSTVANNATVARKTRSNENPSQVTKLRGYSDPSQRGDLISAIAGSQGIYATPPPAPEVTPDGQRDMLAGRADEPFNLTAESTAERKAREVRELAERNAAAKKEAEASRRKMEADQVPLLFAEETTPELPVPENLAPAVEEEKAALADIPESAPIEQIVEAAPVSVQQAVAAYREGQTFSEWSKAAIRAAGNHIASYLSTIWKNIRVLAIGIVSASTGYTPQQTSSLGNDLNAVATISPVGYFSVPDPSLFDGMEVGPFQATKSASSEQKPTEPGAIDLASLTDEEAAGTGPEDTVFLSDDLQKQWLQSAGNNSSVEAAASFLGEKEGKSDLLTKIFKKFGIKESQDTYPWCAAFASYCLTKAGKPTRIFNARGFLDIGTPVSSNPAVGDVAVFWNNNPKTGGKTGWGGHAGFYLGETGSHVVVISGNANDEVNVSAIPKSRLLGYRATNKTPNRAEQWADKTIAENRGQLLSGVPDPSLMAAYAVKGSILIARGIRDFAAWSKVMLDEFGEAIRPHLQQIFADSHANDGQPITDIPAEPSASEKLRSIFEKFFGHDKTVTAAAKEFEARNAGRAALSTLLFDGVAPDHQPGTAFEDTIATLTPEQRNALHDRVLDHLFRMTGSEADANAYAGELKAHLESVPELEGQRNISMAALQYTNLVTAAGILSGVYGETAAFSTIIQTDNDQIKFGLDTANVLRSDLGRLLGSQSGIGARIAEFASLIARVNQDGLKRIGLTDSQIDALSKAVANKTLTANEIEEIFASSTTSPKNASLMDTALAKLQRLVDAAAAQAKPDAATKLATSILSDRVGPLVAKLPVNQIVRAMMAAPAHHRNSAAWRELQINRWLAEQGIDSALASRLARSMDEMVAAVMANVIYQEQERYVIGKKGVGEKAISNPEFAAKYQENPDAVREAIRKGLLDNGAPWQAWFSSVTGIQPLSQQVIADIARLESVLSGDKYLPAEKGIASAKLRDLMDAHFGKDASGWEILAASYDASALSSGTTMGIQFSSPLGRLIGTFGADLIGRAYSPGKAADVIDSLLASMSVYAAELPLAWKYDTAGHTMGNAEQELSKVAVLRRDLEKYRAILTDKNASMAARVKALPRVLIAAQDFLRQAMNAADSAAMAGFQRYFETREVRRLMRRNNITKDQIQSEMDRNGFYRDQVELQADALGYDGPLKRRYIQDALWAREKELSRARTDSPEAHATRMEELAKAAQNEAEFQIFIGEEKDSPGVTDLVDWALGGLQQIGQGAFRNARERVEAGQTALGSLQRIATRAIFGFVGIPLNAARASIWYSPLAAISWANYLAHKSGRAYKNGNPYARSLGNEIAVRQRIKEGIVGNTLILLGVALAQGLGGDDEDKWQINGYGPDPKKYPDEAKAWQRRHTAFSVERIKDGKAETIPFKKGPLEFITAPLMLLGGASDARLNSKLAKEPEAETGAQIIGALRQLSLSSITTGMRNAVGIRDSLQQMGQDNKADQFGSSAGFMVSPIMPWSGAERWIRTWNHPELLERGFKNNLPFAHYRDDARPALNSFGQTIRPAPEITEAIARQTNGVLPGYARTLTPGDNRLYAWMERTGKQPTTYARSTLETRLQQPVTDAQWWDYTKASGQVRYEQTLAAIDGTLSIERTIPLRGKDIKRPGPMKKGLADIDTSDKAAMKEAGEILQDIGHAAHLAGLKAIGMEEPEKEKPKKKAPAIY